MNYIPTLSNKKYNTGVELQRITIKTNYSGDIWDFNKVKGVYKILNIKTNKVYIGSSGNLYERYNRHCTNATNAKLGVSKRNTSLYNEIAKNPEDFIFKFFDWSENYTNEDILKIEQDLLNSYFAKDNYEKFRELTYNIQPNVVFNCSFNLKNSLSRTVKLKYENGYINPKTGYTTSKETKERVLKAFLKSGKCKKVFSYNLISKEVLEHLTIKACSKLTNVDGADIGRILKNKQSYSKNYYFTYEEKKIEDIIEHIKNTKQKIINNSKKANGKVIYIYDLINKTFEKFNTITDCIKQYSNKYKFNPSTITKCLEKSKKENKDKLVNNGYYNNYYFSFLNNENIDSLINELAILKYNNILEINFKVVDLKSDIIYIFKSIKECFETLKFKDGKSLRYVIKVLLGITKGNFQTNNNAKVSKKFYKHYYFSNDLLSDINIDNLKKELLQIEKEIIFKKKKT